MHTISGYETVVPRPHHDEFGADFALLNLADLHSQWAHLAYIAVMRSTADVLTLLGHPHNASYI